MKKFFPIFVLLMIGLIAGCGDDKSTDNGDSGPPRVIANTSLGQPPSLTNANDVRWDSVSTVTISVAQGAPKVVPGMGAAVPSNVKVQAVHLGDMLYMRLQWQDADFDAWPNYFLVKDTGSGPTLLRPIEFKHEQLPPAYEDQVFVLFEYPAIDGWDVWNWRVQTTGGGGLAEGQNFANNILTTDDDGTVVAEVAPLNPPDPVISTYPTYVHKDLSEFENYILYTDDTVNIKDTVEIKVDTTIIGNPPDTLIDTTIVTPLHTRGWTLNQRVPNYLIDSSVVSLSDAERGSRWDIKTADDYTGEYTVVLSRKLKTGFSDDLDMSVIDSVKVKIGFLDNQLDFTQSTSNRGVSREFLLIF